MDEPGSESEASTGSGTSPSGAGTPPFGEALSQIIRQLTGQPLLLFALGAAIILLGAGVWGLEGSRAVTIPLLILLVVAIVAWVFLEALRVRRRGGSGADYETGGVRTKRGAKVRPGGRARTGSITARGEGSARTGDVELGPGAEVGGIVETGGITVGKNDESESP